MLKKIFIFIFTFILKISWLCGSSNPLILADEASLGNVLHRSNSPSHLLGPVELQTNSEGKKINYEGTESEKPQESETWADDVSWGKFRNKAVFKTNTFVVCLADVWDLLYSCLHHPVLACSITRTRHVAFKYERRFDFVELLKQPLVLVTENKEAFYFILFLINISTSTAYVDKLLHSNL